MRISLPIWAIALGLAASSMPAVSQKAESAQAAIPHEIGAAKLIVDDAEVSKKYFETYFGMAEVRRFTAPAYNEPIMGYGDGARLALFAATTNEGVKKSAYPVALVYTPDFDAMTKRIEDAGHAIRHLPAAQSGTYKIAIAQDPSGNAIEILSRPGQPAAVGGSKLIVADREKAEAWFTKVFDVQPTRRFQTASYDEVLLGFGKGAFLALFQPLQEDPLPKSRYPVVAIYTSDFDAVKARVDAEGLGSRVIPSDTMNIIVAQDPSGNAVEIIAR